MKCSECNDNLNIAKVPTYKREWIFCNACGSATTGNEIETPFLSFLPYPFLKRLKSNTEENIYDYFLSAEHKQVSQKNYDMFCKNFASYIKDIETKNIMDISGGSGHFLSFFKRKKNYTLLTEFNKKTTEFAQEKLGLNAIHYDFNSQDISTVLKDNKIDNKFDYVFMNACIMFCQDLKSFTESLAKILRQNAIVILTANVQPTAGLVVRTQFDDYSYLVLRQKEQLASYFKDNFELLEEASYEDPYAQYVTAHDLNFITRVLKSFYANKIAKGIFKSFASENFPSFRLRDRHVFYQVYKLKG